MHRTRPEHLVPAILLSAALLVGLSACGSDSDGAASSAPTSAVAGAPVSISVPTLTSAEFTKQANALCAKESGAIGGVMGPLFASGEPTPAAKQDALDQVVALSRDLSEKIDALAEPSELSEKVNALVAAQNKATDSAEAQGGDKFFSSEDDPWAATGALATDLGLDACAPSEG